MGGAPLGGAPMGARKALCKPRLALSETKLAQPPGSTGSTGTKLSLPPGSTESTGTKLSRHAPKRRFRPSFRAQGELYPACGAASGRKLSQQAALTGPPGTKLSQQAALAGPPGTKLSQRAALAGPPGTKLSQRAPKRRFRPTFRMQGELCTASATNTTSTEKKVTHQHPTSAQQRAPLQISHAIRLHELSTKFRNVAIPTT